MAARLGWLTRDLPPAAVSDQWALSYGCWPTLAGAEMQKTR
jgi:hypothetical protein